jgi:hypothetical protein
MGSLDKGAPIELDIQEKTGHSLEELADIVKRTGLTTHTDIRAMLQREYQLDYGDATALVHALMKG